MPKIAGFPMALRICAMRCGLFRAQRQGGAAANRRTAGRGNPFIQYSATGYVTRAGIRRPDETLAAFRSQTSRASL
jgi:hypothetical protein